MNAFVKHLHAFLREARPTPAEYGVAREFIRKLGQAPIENELDEILILAASFGVDEVLYRLQEARPEGCTKPTQEGPFYFTEGVPTLPSGSSIASPNTKGDKLFFQGSVKNLKGEPIKNALVDVWQADGDGMYDIQYGPQRDDRARIVAKDDGTFTFRGVAPIAYAAFPENGPTYEALAALGRHSYRATHIHFRLEAPGYETLITQIFPSNSPVLGDDSVFATQPSLISHVKEDSDPASWADKGFKDGEVTGGRIWVWEYDFVLPTPEEMKEAKKKLDEKLAAKQG
ncbi:aromatic compound dioxygenase [Auricularia subglabra TFB-10046 SS5]|nr:aromatic compound dioxygenase [Auricularia subglabra TFB-10046 SS5]